MAYRRRPSDDDLQPVIDASLRAFSQLSPPAQLAIAIVLLIGGVICAIIYFRSQHKPHGRGDSNSPNLILGNPSNASTDPTNRSNYLMVKPYYALSYNDTKGTPNWVSWRICESDLGKSPRREGFEADNLLPDNFFKVTQQDYSESGFDRGHMCPHGDRAANQDMSFSTFVMSNIIPQAPNVNRKAWEQMEDYCRDLVNQHERLYVIAGPAGQGGRGSRGQMNSLAGGRVVVPKNCWKIVVIVPDTGVDDAAQIQSDSRVLTVEMPNDNSEVDEQWAQYRTTPSQIEQETGLHFFTALNPALANAFRNRLDRIALPAPRTTNYTHTPRAY